MQLKIKEKKSQIKKLVKQVRLKTFQFMTKITIFKNTDVINFLTNHQLNLNLTC